MEQLRALARAADSSGGVSFDEIAQVVRTLFGSAKQVNDELFKLYEQGKGEDGPLPLRPAIKSSVGVLDSLCDFEGLEPELARAWGVRFRA